MRSGWLSCVIALIGCKAARDYAEHKYDERRAPELARERVAEQEEIDRPPTPRPAGSGLVAGTYRLREVRVAVFPLNKRGNAWDDPPDSSPDPRIEIKVDGKTHASCTRKDTIDVQCTFDDVEIELGVKSLIVVEVVDKDTIVDDPIGVAVLDDPSTWGPGIEMPMVPNGRIRSAIVVLGLPPTWWSENGKLAIGSGVGAIALFGIVFYARTSRRSKAPTRTRCCSACGARLANYAKCSDCGAVQSEDTVS